MDPRDCTTSQLVNHLQVKSNGNALINRIHAISHFRKYAYDMPSLIPLNGGSALIRQIYDKAKLEARAGRTLPKMVDLWNADGVSAAALEAAGGKHADMDLMDLQCALVYWLVRDLGLRQKDVVQLVDGPPQLTPKGSTYGTCKAWQPWAYATKERIKAANGSLWANLPTVHENPASTNTRYQSTRTGLYMEAYIAIKKRDAPPGYYDTTFDYHGQRVHGTSLLAPIQVYRENGVTKKRLVVVRRQKPFAVATIRNYLKNTFAAAGDIPKGFTTGNIRAQFAGTLTHGRLLWTHQLSAADISKLMRHASQKTTKDHYIAPDLPATVAMRWTTAGSERQGQWLNGEWLRA